MYSSIQQEWQPFPVTQSIINPECLELLAGIAKLRKVTLSSPYLNQEASGAEEMMWGWVFDIRRMSVALSHSNIYNLEAGGIRICQQYEWRPEYSLQTVK